MSHGLGMQTRANIEILDVDECLRLLASHPTKLGRLAFEEADGLVILPVNYRLDHGTVVFQTDPGSKLHAMTDGRRVAFEVDDVDVAWHDGWSVMIQGTGNLVTNPERIRGIRTAGLLAWAGAGMHTAEILSTRITGRRLS